MDERFAELLGMHAGDGTIYRTNSSLVWELRGGFDEREFYDSHVTLLVEQCGLQRFWRGVRGRSYGVRTCDRAFIERIRDAGFPVGPKSANLAVPSFVLRAPRSVRAAFLRGVFATDGTAYSARINNEPVARYPIIECSSISRAFIEEITALLEDLGINTYYWNSKRTGIRSPHPLWTVRIAGEARTKHFSERVGLSNPKMKRTTFKNGLNRLEHRAAIA